MMDLALDPPLFRFDNSYARELPDFYVDWKPAPAPEPSLLLLNRSLADELGLDADRLDSEQGARWFAGSEVPSGASPLAQAYAGHQFGGFSPQLGDGRALLWGEVIDRQGRRRDIQLKGSGRTPFSRGGDGKAALGPVLREYLIGEAMFALGIPTTRALAAATTGETIARDGHVPGAVLTRVAASHVRVGTFQYFAQDQDSAKLRQLADYVIARHDPALAQQEDRYLALLAAVRDRQASLIARWMLVGFIHGVMNTDNMTISGETIDFGPCAFMDRFDPETVFSSIDTHGRYAYANQPGIGGWNLARLAEALLPLIDEEPERAVARATETLQAYGSVFEARWVEGMRAKLGLATAEPGDFELAREFLAAMQGQQVDYTLACRALAGALEGRPGDLRELFAQPSAIDPWLARWADRSAREVKAPAERAQAMRRVNPAFIPRNHQVEAALAAAVERADLVPFKRLLAVLSRPFDDQPEAADLAQPAPLDAPPYLTFCGT